MWLALDGTALRLGDSRCGLQNCCTHITRSLLAMQNLRPHFGLAESESEFYLGLQVIRMRIKI